MAAHVVAGPGGCIMLGLGAALRPVNICRTLLGIGVCDLGGQENLNGGRAVWKKSIDVSPSAWVDGHGHKCKGNGET